MINHSSRCIFRRKYGKLDEKNLERAVIVYRNGTAGLNNLSRTYGVSKATLKRHIDYASKYANGSTKSFGRPCTLPFEIEDILVEHILELENMMIGLTRNDFMKIAYQLTEKNDLKHCFNNENESASTHWYRCFMQRHPDLSLRQAEATSVARAKGFNRNNVGDLYNKLEKLIEKHG